MLNDYLRVVTILMQMAKGDIVLLNFDEHCRL
jgi:hypothetical protein